MRILCTTSFKHGKDSYNVNEVRTVSDEDGRYFVKEAWAVEQQEDNSVSLSIDHSYENQETIING